METMMSRAHSAAYSGAGQPTGGALERVAQAAHAEHAAHAAREAQAESALRGGHRPRPVLKFVPNRPLSQLGGGPSGFASNPSAPGFCNREHGQGLQRQGFQGEGLQGQGFQGQGFQGEGFLGEGFSGCVTDDGGSLMPLAVQRLSGDLEASQTQRAQRAHSQVNFQTLSLTLNPTKFLTSVTQFPSSSIWGFSEPHPLGLWVAALCSGLQCCHLRR